MQSVNVNLLVLMSKYDKLNRSLNRAWIQRSDKFLEPRDIHDMKRLLDGASSLTKIIEIFDDIRNASNGNSYTYNSVSPYLSLLRNLDDKYLLSNNVRGMNKENEVTISKPLTKVENDENFNNNDETNFRIKRTILTIEQPNSTKKGIDLNRDEDVVYDSDDDYDDNDLYMRREPRTGRARRDEGRGKKRRKNKRRPKRSRRRLGI